MLFEGPIHMHFKGSFSFECTLSLLKKALLTLLTTLFPSTGSRSPYEILQTGAGFVLGWSGKPRWVIGHPNEERELIQISAERLVFAIPE
jgi:hypothetical protein